MLTKISLSINFTRRFSQSQRLAKSLGVRPSKFAHPRYPTKFEEPVRSDRSEQQRIMNRGKKLWPYDKHFTVTGKNTGPGVEGGSEEAQELAALHLVQPTGYINDKGQYQHVKQMSPEFVVPDLTNFQLKPYVPYHKVSDVDQGRHTARELFDHFYADGIRDAFYAKQEKNVPKKKTGLLRMKRT